MLKQCEFSANIRLAQCSCKLTYIHFTRFFLCIMFTFMEVKVLEFENYIEMIKKSVGSDLFQTIWAEVDGVRKDITDAGKGSGQLSCASHVSGVLLLFSGHGLIKTRHAMTPGLIRDMEASGWHKIDEPKVGAVIHWEKLTRDGTTNEHIGFYIGNDEAVSNSPDERVPRVHHWTFGEEDGKPKRKVEGIYWHPKLDNKYFE